MRYRLKNTFKTDLLISLNKRTLKLPGNGTSETQAPQFRWPHISEEDLKSAGVTRARSAGLIVVEPIEANIRCKLIVKHSEPPEKQTKKKPSRHINKKPTLLREELNHG